jgi:hypothetical protein
MEIYQIIRQDLEEQGSVKIILPPYNEEDEVQQKLNSTFKAMRRAIKLGNRILALVNAFYLGYCIEIVIDTPIDKLMCKNKIPEHYRRIAAKTYLIFEAQGLQQILRTKSTTVAMIQKLNKSSLRKLVNEAAQLSQELQN